MHLEDIMILEGKRILFIGPHPDDVELGCGATIAKLTDGYGSSEIYYVVISPALEDPRNKNIINELYSAASVLGIKKENIVIMNYPRRILHEFRQDIRYSLIELIKDLSPDIIFTTTPDDLHQDHSVIGEEVLRLFRRYSVIGYEVIRSSLYFIPNMYVKLSKQHIDKKVKALMEYKSQLNRYYFKPSVIEALARMRGSQVEAEYAEAFKVLRLVEG